MNPRIIPSVSAREAKARHSDNEEGWVKFCRRAQKNPYVRTFIRIRDAGTCAWCNTRLHAMQVHHTSYDHACTFRGEITVQELTRDGSGAVRERTAIPDCYTCQDTNRRAFDACMSRLVAVHPKCNAAIAASSRDGQDG